ncbi:hypothetical protein BDW66DRAFT_17482 [Aspergillus desertorum]
MDPNGIFARNYDESLIRELPHLRIAPLREPVSSRCLRIPLTLEPSASGIRDLSTILKPGGSAAGILPPRKNEPSGIATEGSTANTARQLGKNDFAASELLTEPQLPPRPILPAFVNLRALERFPYSSFDDDSHQTRKRRRVGVGADTDVQPDTFGELLQLPMPQAQKEQRPPPFGPFAILNGLNEPPPNAALLPPIEAGSITQLLTKPSRDSIDVEPEPVKPATSFTPDVQSGERIEGRIEDILDSPIAEKPNLRETVANDDKIDKMQPETEPSHANELQPTEEADSPPSPKARGRSRKNLRKWTDGETVALLRGVMKCGIGNWKEVLAQDESSFNKRTASNLKDRFRVCCPSAYRASDPSEAIQHLRDALAKTLARIEGDSSATPSLTHSGSSSSFSSLDTSQNTPEHHSQSDSVPEINRTLPKNKSEPATGGLLVISEPYTPAKGRRRSRRPFTAAEDEALLKGYAVHGFQWTLIQQDNELNLGHRRATDLRDRFRTKFPHAYRDGGAIRDSTLQAQMAKDTMLKDGTSPAARSRQAVQDNKSASTDRPGKPNTLGGVVAVDPVLPSLALPPVVREGSTSVPLSGLSFLLEEGSTNDNSVDLPPLIWDDLT